MPALRATVSCALSIVFLRSVHHDPALRAIVFETIFFNSISSRLRCSQDQRAPAPTNHSHTLSASVIGVPTIKPHSDTRPISISYMVLQEPPWGFRQHSEGMSE